MSNSDCSSTGDADKMSRDTLPAAPGLALHSDLRLLRTGDYADFTIHCRERKWRVHKSILTRCPYYTTILNKDRNWSEKTEAKSVIEGFEPFEVNWLIQYIYCPVIDINDLVNDLPSKSYLEVCGRLGAIGDYFGLSLLTKSAVDQLGERVRQHMRKAVHISSVVNGVPFMDELEAAIRLVWTPGYRGQTAFRTPLLILFRSVQPFLHKHFSAFKLLEELPEFSVDFAKITLNLYKFDRGSPLIGHCECCGDQVLVVPRLECAEDHVRNGKPSNEDLKSVANRESHNKRLRLGYASKEGT